MDEQKKKKNKKYQKSISPILTLIIFHPEGFLFFFFFKYMHAIYYSFPYIFPHRVVNFSHVFPVFITGSIVLKYKKMYFVFCTYYTNTQNTNICEQISLNPGIPTVGFDKVLRLVVKPYFVVVWILDLKCVEFLFNN